MSNPFEGLFQQGLASQPNTNKDILSFLSSNPVPDHIDPLIAERTNMGLQGLRNQGALEQQRLVNQGEVDKLQMASEAKAANNRSIMELFRGGQPGASPMSAQLPAQGQGPLASTSPEDGSPDLTVIDVDGKEYTGHHAGEVLHNTIVKDDLYATSQDPNGGPAVERKLGAAQEAQASGYVPKISMDKDGNLSLEYEQLKPINPADILKNQKEEALTKKAIREVGGDKAYLNSQFPGYQADPGAEFSEIPDRVKGKLKEKYAETTNALGNIDELIQLIQTEGIPATDMTPHGRRVKQLYNNALASVTNTMGGGTEDEAGLMPWSSSRNKLASGVLIDPTGAQAQYWGRDKTIQELKRAKEIIQGDLDSSLGAYNYKPKVAVLKDRDGTVYSITYRDKDKALKYLRGETLEMPQSMKKVKGGTTDRVPESTVTITSADGSRQWTAPASKKDQYKQLLRGQGIDIA